MSSSSELPKYYSLDVRYDDGILPTNKLPPCPNASFIHINLHINFHVFHPTNIQGLFYTNIIPLDHQYTRDTVYLSNDWFLTKDGAERYIYCVLDELRAPRNQQQPMADKFLTFVKGMASDNYFANQSLLPIVLDIYANFGQMYYNGIASVIRGFMDFRKGEPKRAKTSSIQTLERVDSSLVSMEECAICLEKFPVGRELTRLSCSHVYHHHCIGKWLRKSRFCPLCRFCID